jgi:hypothetical protein
MRAGLTIISDSRVIKWNTVRGPKDARGIPPRVTHGVSPQTPPLMDGQLTTALLAGQATRAAHPTSFLLRI